MTELKTNIFFLPWNVLRYRRTCL